MSPAPRFEVTFRLVGDYKSSSLSAVLRWEEAGGGVLQIRVVSETRKNRFGEIRRDTCLLELKAFSSAESRMWIGFLVFLVEAIRRLHV